MISVESGNGHFWGRANEQGREVGEVGVREEGVGGGGVGGGGVGGSGVGGGEVGGWGQGSMERVDFTGGEGEGDGTGSWWWEATGGLSWWGEEELVPGGCTLLGVGGMGEWEGLAGRQEGEQVLQAGGEVLAGRREVASGTLSLASLPPYPIQFFLSPCIYSSYFSKVSPHSLLLHLLLAKQF